MPREWLLITIRNILRKQRNPQYLWVRRVLESREYLGRALSADEKEALTKSLKAHYNTLKAQDDDCRAPHWLMKVIEEKKTGRFLLQEARSSDTTDASSKASIHSPLQCSIQPSSCTSNQPPVVAFGPEHATFTSLQYYQECPPPPRRQSLGVPELSVPHSSSPSPKQKATRIQAERMEAELCYRG